MRPLLQPLELQALGVDDLHLLGVDERIRTSVGVTTTNGFADHCLSHSATSTFVVFELHVGVEPTTSSIPMTCSTN